MPSHIHPSNKNYEKSHYFYEFFFLPDPDCMFYGKTNLLVYSENHMLKEMWPLNEGVLYVRIQAAKTGLI